MGREIVAPHMSHWEYTERELRSHIKTAAAGKTGLNNEQLANLLCSAFPQTYSRRNHKTLVEQVSKISGLTCRRVGVTKKRKLKLKARNVSNPPIEVSSSSGSASSSRDPDSNNSKRHQSESVKVNENDDGGKTGGTNRTNSRDLEGNAELGGGRRETNKNGDGCGRDITPIGNVSNPIELSSSSDSASSSKEDSPDSNDCKRHKCRSEKVNENGKTSTSGTNRPNSRDLEGNDALGDGKREMSKNGDGCGRDITPIQNLSGNNRPMFRDLWGMDCVLQELKREVIVPLHQLKLLCHLGVEPMARILFHGPPGCGKTVLARAVANETGVPFFEISAAALTSGVPGAQEEKIRELFSKAYARAPSIVFIDEIDAMTLKTESLHKSVVLNQLMTCMDEPYKLKKPANHDVDSESSNNRPGYVLVIGATNKPDAVDPVLRQRFDSEIVIGAPNESARFNILSVLMRNLKVEAGFDCAKLARCALGFVGGDLVALVKKAGIHAVNRTVDIRNSKLSNEQKVGFQLEDYVRQPLSDEEMKNLSITMADFVEAGKMVQPSSKIEGFSTTPNAKWDDVGGLPLVKLEFERHIVNPIKFPEVYKDLGSKSATTYFLYGPSGCGKTLIVEALANEAGASLMHIKAGELSKYGDESGLVVQIIFNYASTHSPCIIFFDELDVITPYDEDKGQWPDFRQLVVELNNAERMTSVYVIGATNRRAITSHFTVIQTQFDKVLYVPPPSPEERVAILKVLARNKPIDANLDLIAVGCKKFKGADLSALMKEAVKVATDHPTMAGGVRSSPWTIKDADFKTALKKIYPFVSSTWERKSRNASSSV